MSKDEQRKKATAQFGPVKKAVVIQGSPRGKKGRTDFCLQLFLKGLNQKGVSIEVVYLNQRKIKPCLGCFTCWEKTPGVCVHKGDEMPELLEKMKAADLWVMAQPLYYYSVPGIVKNFLDRTLPLAEPFQITDPEGNTMHPRRWSGNTRVVILSVCGFPEAKHFQPMLDLFRFAYRSPDKVIIGELLRPAAEIMPQSKLLGNAYRKAVAALEKAGQEVAQQGFVSQVTEEEVAVPFFRNNRHYYDMANAYWEASLAYHQAKHEGQKLPSLEDYLKQRPGLFFTGMAVRLDAQKAGELQGVLQFKIIGEPSGSYFLEIKDGLCFSNPGQAPSPTLTITTPWDVWLGISEGKTSGQEAFMQGKYTVEGDVDLLMRLGELFGG